MKHSNGTMQKIGACIFLFLSAATTTIFGLYIGKLVDAVYEGDSLLFVRRLIIAAAAILLDMLFTILGRACVYADCCHKAETLKNKVYQRELNKVRADNVDISNFSDKINLVYNDDFFNRWLIYSNILVFIFSCIAIISINWIMLFVALAVSLIPMIVPSFFKNHVQKAADNYSKESSRYLAHVNDTLQGRLEIMKYNAAHTFYINHSKANNKFEYARYKNRTANNKARTVTSAVGNSAIMLLFLAGGILTLRGLIGIGGVIGVIQLMNNVVNPVVEIAGYKNEINACKPVLNELNKPLGHDHDEKKTIVINEGIGISLQVKDISYRYNSEDKYILNKFNYQFKAGGKYLIYGESGSGKTTLAKLLAGELKPETGIIKIDGQDIQTLSDEQIFQIIRYVDQKTYIFSDTIENNILLFRDIEKEKITNIKIGLGIHGLDMEKQVDDNNGISGGQKARVCLARAVAVLPNVIIADEPAAALDSDNAYKVMKYICNLPITVIVISHNVDEKITGLFNECIPIA